MKLLSYCTEASRLDHIGKALGASRSEYLIKQLVNNLKTSKDDIHLYEYYFRINFTQKYSHDLIELLMTHVKPDKLCGCIENLI